METIVQGAEPVIIETMRLANYINAGEENSTCYQGGQVRIYSPQESEYQVVCGGVSKISLESNLITATLHWRLRGKSTVLNRGELPSTWTETEPKTIQNCIGGATAYELGNHAIVIIWRSGLCAELYPRGHSDIQDRYYLLYKEELDELTS